MKQGERARALEKSTCRLSCISNVFVQFSFHRVTLFHSLSFFPMPFPILLEKYLPRFHFYSLLLSSNQKDRLASACINRRLEIMQHGSFSKILPLPLCSSPKGKHAGKDGLRDWTRTLFYCSLQLSRDCRSHWRETMCSGDGRK